MPVRVFLSDQFAMHHFWHGKHAGRQSLYAGIRVSGVNRYADVAAGVFDITLYSGCGAYCMNPASPDAKIQACRFVKCWSARTFEKIKILNVAQRRKSMAYSLPRDVFLLLEAAFNQDRDKAETFDKAIESSIRAIDEKADETKQVVKAELYNELRNVFVVYR